jgi:hypothetical protein
MLARMIVLAQRLGIGVDREVMNAVVVVARHIFQFSGIETERTLLCSIPQGIDAGWRKPGRRRGSVHESLVGLQGRCGQFTAIRTDG